MTPEQTKISTEYRSVEYLEKVIRVAEEKAWKAGFEAGVKSEKEREVHTDFSKWRKLQP